MAGDVTEYQETVLRLARLADSVDRRVAEQVRNFNGDIARTAQFLGLERATIVVVALAAGLLVSGCSEGGSVSSGAACEIFAPLSWSKKDTKPTKEQIKSHNAAGKAACAWSAK